MRRYLSAFLLTAVLAIPTARVLRADDDHDNKDKDRKEHREKRYYDKDAKDWHNWDDREDRSWRQYSDEKHAPAHDWVKAKPEERRDYWKWRHNHPDAPPPDPR